MTILRINKKEKNFLLLDKTCLNEKSLSWGAKGLHTYLMSMPNNWHVKVNHLREQSTNGRDSVRGLLKELEKAGYIRKTVCRNDVSGRFDGLEYSVFELPELENIQKIPKPEKPFSELLESENPTPDNPVTEKPLPENAPLISINSNKYLINNKTAAKEDYQQSLNSLVETKTKKAAAVFLENEKNNQKKISDANKRSSSINSDSVRDSVIAGSLTQNQLTRIDRLVTKINSQVEVNNAENLSEEIRYCILNPKNFTACGQDFGRKLNAIGKVILRGDWQTPTNMVIAAKQKSKDEVEKLKSELQLAQSEARHFSKLLPYVEGENLTYFKKVISAAQIKIKNFENQIRAFYSNPEESMVGV